MPTCDEQEARNGLCCPRFQNLIDQALENLRSHVSRLDPALVSRFRAAQGVDAQRFHQDLGVGLCGRRGRRLSRESQSSVTCPDCRQLLRAAFLSRPASTGTATPTAPPVSPRGVR